MLKKKVVLKVDGMHCNHCANKIKEICNNVSNVLNTKVNIESKEVIISYIKEINLDDIKSKIDFEGYKVVDGL